MHPDFKNEAVETVRATSIWGRIQAPLKYYRLTLNVLSVADNLCTLVTFTPKSKLQEMFDSKTRYYEIDKLYSWPILLHCNLHLET
jgi:hypothetical protein